MAVRIFILLFFFCGTVQAVCPVHPNLILCWDTQEGNGTITRDGSRTGLTGILNGGPAWVKAPGTMALTGSSNTAVNMGVFTISFPGTAGVELFVPSTSLFDFSGNKPYTVAFSFQSSGFPLPGFENIVSYSDGSTAVGWGIYMEPNGHIVVTHIGVANSSFGGNINDLNPHRFLVARNVGNVYAYLDGRFYGSETGKADMNIVSNIPFGFCQPTISAASYWNGKAGNLLIYNFFPGPSPEAVAAFAYNDYIQSQIGGIQ